MSPKLTPISAEEAKKLRQRFREGKDDYPSLGALWYTVYMPVKRGESASSRPLSLYMYRDFSNGSRTGKDAAEDAQQDFSQLATRAVRAAGYKGARPVEAWLSELVQRGLGRSLGAYVWEGNNPPGKRPPGSTTYVLKNIFKSSATLVESLEVSKDVNAELKSSNELSSHLKQRIEAHEPSAVSLPAPLGEASTFADDAASRPKHKSRPRRTLKSSTNPP